jgi:hypothetical protein
MESWCERWNINIHENKPRAIYFSHRRRQVEAYLTPKGQHIPFVNNVKYLGVMFDKKHYMEITYRNDRRQSPSNIYPLLKSGLLSVNAKLTLY